MIRIARFRSAQVATLYPRWVHFLKDPYNDMILSLPSLHPLKRLSHSHIVVQDSRWQHPCEVSPGRQPWDIHADFSVRGDVVGVKKFSDLAIKFAVGCGFGGDGYEP